MSRVLINLSNFGDTKLNTARIYVIEGPAYGFVLFDSLWGSSFLPDFTKRRFSSCPLCMDGQVTHIKKLVGSKATFVVGFWEIAIVSSVCRGCPSSYSLSWQWQSSFKKSTQKKNICIGSLETPSYVSHRNSFFFFLRKKES